MQEFPSVTEQFIRREISALANQEISVQPFAMQPTHGLPPNPDTVYYSNSRVMKQIPGLLFMCFAGRTEVKTLLRELSHVMGAGRSFVAVLRALYLVKYLNRLGITHIHCHFLTMPAVLGYIVSRLSHTSYSLSGHAKDIFCPDYPQMPEWFDKADRIFFCTRHGLEHFRSRFPSVSVDKLMLAPHGVDLGDLSPSEKKPASLIAAGRLVPKKGYVHLIEAVRILKGRGRSLTLHIFGEGAEQSTLAHLIARYNLSDNITMEGFIPHDRLLNRISRASALIHPSITAQDGDVDGIPNTILEAMAIGTPVVAGNIPSISGAFSGGNDIILVDPSDHEALANAIEKILRDNALAERISTAARATIARSFNLEENTKPLARLFVERTGGRIRVLEGLEATIGGTRRHLRLLLDNLPRDRFDLHFACSTLRSASFGGDIDHYKTMGIQVHVIQMKRSIDFFADFLAIMEFYRLLMRIRPDVIHLHSSKAGYIGRVAAWLCGYRNVIYSPHAFAFLGYSGFPRRTVFLLAERILGRLTRKLVAVSESEKGEAVSNAIMLPEDIVVAQNALPATEPAGKPRNGEITRIGFFGRLERQKGCETLIRAIPAIVKDFPQIRVEIAGDGSLRNALETLARRLCPSSIVFSGPCENAREFFDRIDLLVLPSLWEGNPYTLWEAVRHRIPFIASDIPAHREILGSNSACLFKTDNPVNLGETLSRVMQSSEKSTESIDFPAIEARCTFEYQLALLQSLYQETRQ